MDHVKFDLIKRTKKGVIMFYIGTVYWLLLGVLSFTEIHMNLLGLIYFIGAGMLFPLGILISNLMQVDFVAKSNPLSSIAGVIGGMQILFIPINIFIYMENIEWLPFFVAVLTGAHFLPFSPLYNSKAYIFQAIGVVGFSTMIGFVWMDSIYTILPFGLAIIYFITSLMLKSENKKLMDKPESTIVIEK
jgi:hypothetical protein